MSLLVSHELENFMSIESATIHFDKSNVINIVGYNDSGKSAITRSFEVLYYDAYSTDQVSFIKDGCDYFKVTSNFDDGVSVSKTKLNTGKSIWELRKDGKIIYTNKLNNSIAAISGVPQQIQEYLGVVEDELTGEKLNVRRNSDKLFLIDTSGGDNYKIINTVLRCDILADAVKLLNEDRNKLQSEFASKSTEVMTLRNTHADIEVLDDHVVSILTTNKEILESRKKQLDYINNIQTQKQVLDTSEVYQEVPLVDSTRLVELTNIQNLSKSLEVPIYEEVQQVDTQRLMALQSILSLQSSLEEGIYREVPLVDSSQLQAIRGIGEVFNQLWQVNQDLANIEAEYTQVKALLKSLSEKYNYKICNSCGTVVI